MSNFIQISEAASIALHSMALLANDIEKLFNVKQITEKIEASDNHLAKVMQRLSKAGLIKSVRGPKGGFTLAKKKDDITLLDIYEAIEGNINVKGCPLIREKCPFKTCIFGNFLTDTNKKMAEYLSSKTLAEFADNAA